MIRFRGLMREDWGWFNQRNPARPSIDSTAVVAIDDSDEIQAMCLMDTWTNSSCQCHIAIDNPMVLRHGFLEQCFNFAFVEADRCVMVGLVPEDNKKALKFNERIGFKEEYRLKNGYDYGTDYVVMVLHREDCEYVEKREAA